MTLRENLKNQLYKDYAKAPPKYFNTNNLEMTWSKNENIYIGIDSKGKEWIAALQSSRVPIFFVSCTNKQIKDSTETNCGAINIVPIFDNDKKITCRKCKKEFTVEIIIPKSSVAYEISQNLDK